MVYEIDFCRNGEVGDVFIEADSFDEAEKSFNLLFPDSYISVISETEMPPVCIKEVAA